MSDEKIILVEKTDGVAVITLNRPDKLNAFAPGMLAQLDAALDRAQADAGVAAVVLTTVVLVPTVAAAAAVDQV